jgi:pimeloyl-ACP methyl ester carboxylesterase
MTTTEIVKDYVDAGGVRTYYEAQGAGDPVVVLHGGFCTVETFGGLVPPLAEQYRVWAPERRGHGRTADVDGPITYDNMSDDTIAFLDAVGVGPAHLVGWSDGALVALLVALRRPELVRKLVLIGQSINHDGEVPEARVMAANMSADALPPFLRELYVAVSPDGPEHFDVVAAKLIELYQTEPSVPLAEVKAVTAPTLVVIGDDDICSVEHAAAVARAIPDAQLAVVPNTSHGLPMEKPALLAQLIVEFLAPEQPPKMMGFH